MYDRQFVSSHHFRRIITYQFERNFEGHSRVGLRRSNGLPSWRDCSERLELLHVFAVKARNNGGRADETAEDRGELHGD